MFSSVINYVLSVINPRKKKPKVLQIGVNLPEYDCVSTSEGVSYRSVGAKTSKLHVSSFVVLLLMRNPLFILIYFTG